MRYILILFLLIFNSCTTSTKLDPSTGLDPETSPEVPEVDIEKKYPYFNVNITELKGFSREEKKFILETYDYIKLMVNTPEFAEAVLSKPKDWRSTLNMNSMIDPSSRPTVAYGAKLDKGRMLKIIQQAAHKICMERIPLAPPTSGFATTTLILNNHPLFLVYNPYIDDLSIMNQAKGNYGLADRIDWVANGGGGRTTIYHEMLHTLGFVHDVPNGYFIPQISTPSDDLDDVWSDLWNSPEFNNKYKKDLKNLIGYHEKKFAHLL